MIDAELMGEQPPDSPTTKAQLLSGLLQHELVRLYRYADDGPPPGGAPKPEHPSLYDGWVVVSDHEPADSSWGVVFESTPGAWSIGGVMGNAVDIAAQDGGADVYRDLSPAEASSRRRSDGLAAQVALQAIGADLYVTERPYLHATHRQLTRGVTVCSIADALPLLGLYFRAQQEYPVARRSNFNHGLFFWVGMRELLPEAWRWFSACVQHSSGSGDDSLILLGASLLQRVVRALEARDAIHVALDQPQNHDTQQEALSQLDVALVFLMGTMDVAARVAHRVLALPSNAEYRAAWQNRRRGGWLDQVRATQPALASIVDPGSSGGHTLTILRLLRNSVHGAALQGLAAVTGASPVENLVGLPVDAEVDLIASMDALGGRAGWGVRRTLVPGRVHMDPGVFVDRLFDEVLAVINNLIAMTPVERLAHVTLSAVDCHPPPPAAPGQPTDSFEPWIRASIRWQLGF